MKTAVLVLAAAQMIFAAASSIYPGSTKLPDRTNRNPDHVVTYSTPDAFPKVVNYYKQLGKVTDTVEGTAVIALTSGEGVIIRDLKTQGSVVVLAPAKKK
jgi:hypothetical protein